MKYTITVNAEARTVTVNYKGYEGVARCCPTDAFNVQVGVELALERARVAEKQAKMMKGSKPLDKYSPAELAEALEKALPKGQMCLVGAGEELTANQKRWLANLIGVTLDEDAYDEGYAEGRSDAVYDAQVVMERITSLLDEAYSVMDNYLEEVEGE